MSGDDDDMVMDILLADFIHAFVLPRVSASGHLLKASRKAMAKVHTSTLAARVGKDITAKPKGSIAYHICVAACTEKRSTMSLVKELKAGRINGQSTKTVYLNGAVQFDHTDDTIRLSEATGSIGFLPKKKVNHGSNTASDLQRCLFRYSSDNATFSDWKEMSLLEHNLHCLEFLEESTESPPTNTKPKSKEKAVKTPDLANGISDTHPLTNRKAARKTATARQNKRPEKDSQSMVTAPSSTTRETIGLFEASHGYGPILRLPGLSFQPEKIPSQDFEVLEDAGKVIPKCFSTTSKPPSDYETLIQRLEALEVIVRPTEQTASNANEDTSQALSDLHFTQLDTAKNEILSYAIERYMLQTQTSPEVARNRSATVKRLRNDINDAWKGRQLRIEAFGSCANSLHRADSDLDLCIVDPSDCIGKKRNRTFYEPRILASVLRKYGYVKVIPISNALVPIVKLEDPIHHFSIDINASHTLGIHNSLLIKTYCELDSRVRPFMFTLKRWAEARGLNNPSGSRGPITMNSYTIVMLGIFYLQVIGILPRLQAKDLLTEQGVKTERAIHHEWQGDSMLDVTFFRGATLQWWQPKIASRRDLPSTHASVLLGFFQFYATFDAMKYIVSIRNGTMLERSHDMPDTWKEKVLIVQDPFILEKNTAGGMVTSTAKLIFPSEFQRGVNMLLNSADPLADLCKEQILPKQQKRNRSKPNRPSEPGRKAANDAVDDAIDVKTGDDSTAVDLKDLPEIVARDDLDVESTDIAAIGDNAEATSVLLDRLKIEDAKLEAS